MDLGDEVTWAMDLVDGRTSLLLALLLNHGQTVLYLSNRPVNRASSGYRDEGRTDARDATIIADQARLRRDRHSIRPGDKITTELRTLTARRADLVADRTRAVTRLREQLLGILPALERAFDQVNHKGALVLLTGHQIPAALCRIGVKCLERWLVNRKVCGADAVARVAVKAAAAQHTVLPGETITAQTVHILAKEVIALKEKVAKMDKLIKSRFRQHPAPMQSQDCLASGPLLEAEFPAVHRPKRYHRRLQRVFLFSALNSIGWRDESRRFQQRRHAGEKRHTQAVLALARRRVNVLWAMLRDRQRQHPTPPVTSAA